MKKRLLSTLLVLCMVLALMPGTVWAEEDSGTCGNNLTWSYRDGTLTIQGTGKMNDYDVNTAQPWYSYKYDIKEVRIGDGVTSIGDWAFNEYKQLTSVTIGNGVTTIGVRAFYGCYSLTSATIGNRVTSIGHSAFGSCSSLTSVTIPDSVTSIGAWAFASCTDLGSVTIGRRVTSIGDTAFARCSSLTSVMIPDGVTFIGANAFDSCSSLASVTIPDSVTFIGAGAFKSTKLTNVTIPGGVDRIGAEIHEGGSSGGGTFEYCSELKGVTILEGLMCIGAWAFSGCSSLTYIVIPKSVTSIERNAFDGCSTLPDIYYGGSENSWKAIEWDRYYDGGDDTPRILANATVHFNSAGPGDGDGTGSGGQGSAGERPEPDVPDVPDVPDPTEYKIYRNGGYEVFDVSLETCMSKTVSSEYNPQLAHMLVALSNAAYNDADISRSFSNLGFSGYSRYSLLFITYSIGTKQLDDGTTLALVVVRGSGSTLDWASNFDLRLNSSRYHTGFSDAADEIYKSLTSKLGGENFSNVKFVITGHSRGAAAANLLEIKLWEKGVPIERVYGYNFACPDVAVGLGTRWNWTGEHNNIFNIANAADPVSMIPGVLGGAVNPIPLTSWGKFGQSRWYAKNWNDLSETTMDFAKHDQKLYLDNLRNEPSFSSFKTWADRRLTVTGSQLETIGKLFNICCPVDVVIKDSNGTSVASVIDGEVNYYGSTFGEVIIFTDEDRKAIFVQGNDSLTVHLTATGDGTMDYTVQTVNVDLGEVISEKTFSNVPLTTGQQMLSTVNDREDDHVDVSEVPLYILDENGEPDKEVSTDGTVSDLPKTPETSAPSTPSYPTTDGGDSSDNDPTYSISLPSRITGGTVKVTPTSASEGQRVTITVKPSAGHELDILTVTDSKGNSLTLTDKGDGKYTFTMPKSNVSVDAQFQRIESTVTPVQPVSVNPTNDKLEVDGKPQTPAAYKINDYNYFKLRDIAALLNGTGKQFSVDYASSTGEVTLTSGQPYEVTASDLAALPAESRQAMVSTNVIYINGVRTQLTVYLIDGYNYFKLRDLASALDFYVDWTAERGMFLESDKPYSA